MMICRRATVLPIEIVVRGYLSGSGWKEYRRRRTVCGVAAAGRACARATACPSRSSRPATKAPSSASTTMNIDFESHGRSSSRLAAQRDDWLGDDAARVLAERARDVALRLYAPRRRALRARPGSSSPTRSSSSGLRRRAS